MRVPLATGSGAPHAAPAIRARIRLTRSAQGWPGCGHWYCGGSAPTRTAAVRRLTTATVMGRADDHGTRASRAAGGDRVAAAVGPPVNVGPRQRRAHVHHLR